MFTKRDAEMRLELIRENEENLFELEELTRPHFNKYWDSVNDYKFKTLEDESIILEFTFDNNDRVVYIKDKQDRFILEEVWDEERVKHWSGVYCYMIEEKKYTNPILKELVIG